MYPHTQLLLLSTLRPRVDTPPKYLLFYIHKPDFLHPALVEFRTGPRPAEGFTACYDVVVPLL